jgi:hypothetical protein
MDATRAGLAIDTLPIDQKMQIWVIRHWHARARPGAIQLASRNEPSVAAAGNRLDGDAKRLTDVGQPPASVAQIAERRALEAALGERAQNRHDTFRVMPVRRRDIDRQRDVVFVDSDVDFDAVDLLAAVDTAVKAARRQNMGTAVCPAKTSPGPWDAFADVDAFVDEVLAELDTMAKGGGRSDCYTISPSARFGSDARLSRHRA